MSSEIDQLLTELNESVTSSVNDKAISCINSISQQIKKKYIESHQPYNEIDQNEFLIFFTEIYKRMIPLISATNHKGFNNSLNSFINHWNGIISSLNPLIFLKLCEKLNDDGLTKSLYFFILPVTRSIAIVDSDNYNSLIVKILKETNINFVSSLSAEIWHTLVMILSVDQVADLINYFIKVNKNEKGVSILVSKDRSKLIETVFINASMEFICKFLILTPKKVRFDVFTISSRITETMTIEGYNPEIAFDMIPFVVKDEEPNEVDKSAFYPFWPTIIEYLQKKQSVSALYALQSGYKVKMVDENQLVRFLKLEEKTDLRYRLASFKISLEMIECNSVQKKLFPIIHEISMTRSNAMLCCLVDHLPVIFPTLLKHDENYAYDVINTIMNPIPYDQYLPPFILHFLNSVNPKDEHFTFSVEKVIYKYMNLPLNINAEIKKLMEKIDMKIEMSKVDWFDICLSNSINLVEDVSPDLLLEIISQEILHISYIPNILEKLTQICTRKENNCTFYNKSNVDCRKIFDMSVFTLVKILNLLGLDLEGELKKKNEEPFPIGDTFISNSYIIGCVNCLLEPIAPSFLGSLIRSLIKLINSLISSLNETEKLPSNLFMSFLIIADFLSIFMADQSFLILSKVKDYISDNDYFKKIESNAIKNSALSYSKTVVNYLINEKGPEETIKIEKKKSLKAASVDFEIAKKLAPFIDQPIPKYKTFLAFEGIEKHKEWIDECKKYYSEDQWITAPDAKEEVEENDKIEEEEEEKSENEEKIGFKLDENSTEIEKGIDGFLDGNKYSIVTFLNYGSNKHDLKSINESISIEEIEEFVMKNSSDIRLVTGFFYYALCHEYHTPKYNEWVKLIQFKQGDEERLYTASLFLTSLVGKSKSNLNFNLGKENEEKINEPIEFKFGQFSEELSKFILDGLKSIGYYVISKELVIFAFSHEISYRWFFIRSIISLDPSTFSNNALITAEFTIKDKLIDVYKPFFDGFHQKANFQTLISVFSSLTQIYFVPEKSMLIQTKHFPIVHDCLCNLGVSISYPSPITLDGSIIDSFLLALSKQKYFPITFFTFFSHTRLTDKQFEIVRSLLSPKTKAASNFFNYLLPSAYFSDTFPSEASLTESEKQTINMDSSELTKQIYIDKETAIHFSNKPPSFSRAFYRSLMLPFTPILPQKLIIEIKDLLCYVFPPLSYATLNTWPNLNDFDQILFQKYPDDLIDHFKIAGRETIDIFRSVMNDSSFAKKKEITDQFIMTAFSMGSNVNFALNTIDALFDFKINVEDLFKNIDIVNSPQFCCLCVAFCYVKRKLNLDNDFKESVKALLDTEEKRDLFENMNQKETMEQIVHYLFKDSKLPKFQWKKKLFFKP